MARVRTDLAVLIGALCVAACTSLTGVSDLDVADSEDGGSVVDAGGGATDGDRVETEPGCPLPTCAVPDGWSPVLYQRSTRDACPAGSAAAQDVIVVPSETTCACTCSPTPGASCTAGVTIGFKNDEPTCTGSAPTSLNGNDGKCVNLPVTLNDSVGAKIIVGAAGGCQPKTSLPPAPQGRLCPQARLVEGPPVPHETCIARTGHFPCPAPFGRESHVVAASALDQRKCGCKCEGQAVCSDKMLDLFSLADCAGGPITVTEGCQGISAAGTYPSYKYRATANGSSCTAKDDALGTPIPEAGAPIRGEITPTAPQTVCCL
jgi:hypothetical protein